MIYGIDIDYEYETYRNVGVDYKIGKWKKYLSCCTYSEWENHINSIVEREMPVYNDFLHWLYGKRNEEIKNLEIVKAVLIPVYIALITLFDTLLGNFLSSNPITNSFLLIFLLIVIVIVSTCILYKSIEKKHFFDDFIEIVKKRKIS